MKKIFLLLGYLLAFQASLVAQKNYLLEPTNEWIVEYSIWSQDIESIWYYFGISDSVYTLNGKQYTLVEEQEGPGSTGTIDERNKALFRLDTTNQILYCKPFQGFIGKNAATDTQEFVFMRADLQDGDSLIYPALDSMYVKVAARQVSRVVAFTNTRDSFLEYRLLLYNKEGLFIEPRPQLTFNFAYGYAPFFLFLTPQHFFAQGDAYLVCFDNQYLDNFLGTLYRL